MCRVRDVVLKDCRDVFLCGLSAKCAVAAIAWAAGGASDCVRERGRERKRVRRATYLWEVSLAVADQQARLSAATVADDDDLL